MGTSLLGLNNSEEASVALYSIDFRQWCRKSGVGVETAGCPHGKE
jgi:hypothetical protein